MPNTSPTLCYCTNVYPSDTLADIERILKVEAPAVRAALGTEKLRVGLHFPSKLADSLLAENEFPTLSRWLTMGGLDCVTLNAFPYAAFHGERLKHDVYHPNWTTSERKQYSSNMLSLAHALSPVKPSPEVVAVSTVAGGAKSDIGTDAEKLKDIAWNLGLCAAEAWRYFEETGIRCVLALEPEPFTLLENVSEVVSFFRKTLVREGRKAVREVRDLPRDLCEHIIRQHIGICWDCCHAAVEFEDGAAALETLKREGITVGKIQVSNALELRAPSGIEELAKFDEPRYLHQTFIKQPDAAPAGHLDLPEALAELRRLKADSRPFTARTHFHVPVFWDSDTALGSTQADLKRTLAAARRLNITDCYEVETYTWGVLPEQMRPASLADGIAQEMRWASDELEIAL